MSLFSQFHDLAQFVWPHAVPISAGDRQLVERALRRADTWRGSTDAQLRTYADALRLARQAEPASLTNERLIESLALTTEALRRTLSITLYDVQLLAGLALVRGSVAEMQTGEGKTFAAALPAAWHGWSGNGVHLATPNSYLAERDYRLLSPAFELLGLRVGLLRTHDSPDAKRAAYAADITYGTGYDFGFDYLRDQLAVLAQSRQALGQSFLRQLAGGSQSVEQKPLQRGHAHAIIDEIDAVLIDEACTPLVLSDRPSSPNGNAQVYLAAHQCATALQAHEHYIVDVVARTVRLTPAGDDTAHRHLTARPALRLDRPWSEYVEQALTAQHHRLRDVDYVVHEGQIRLVDEYTGRVFTDRSWRNGLQQAVEAKERVTVTTELSTAAAISRQRYFRRYESMAGLTGTAFGAHREFWNTYHLPVTVIPLRTPSQAIELPTRYFATEAVKLETVVAAIAEVHGTGRPVLVGSRTIENSERLAVQLGERALPFRLLNGKQDEDEASIIARAGEQGAVTIATNMAGRGTDIQLGPGVAELGGMHLIGLERHESERIDRQLAGRVARHGQPGSYQFFVSADDPLLVRHDPVLAEQIRRAAGSDQESRHDFSAEIARLQARLERHQYRQRTLLMAHDRWLDELRDKFATGG